MSDFEQYLDKVTDPANENHGMIQVVFTPGNVRPLRDWLRAEGCCLTPIPNGERDGLPVLDSSGDLPAFAIGRMTHEEAGS